jgi:predicted DNA-binding protein
MAVKETNHRVTATISEDEFQRMQYWSARAGLSINEFLRDAIEEKIKRANGDYDLPTLEQQRLNQLIEVIVGLRDDVNRLGDIFHTDIDALNKLTKGDTKYLSHTLDDGDVG